MTPADKRLTRGIYKRKNSYWLNVQKDNKRTFISLRTSDLAVAIRKAAAMEALSRGDEQKAVVQNAQASKAPAQRLADTAGKYLVFVAIGSGLLAFLGWYFFAGGSFLFALTVGVSTVVICRSG